MHTRPLTTAVVQQHLADLGVDPEFGTHSHMRGLSGEYPKSLLLTRLVLVVCHWEQAQLAFMCNVACA